MVIDNKHTRIIKIILGYITVLYRFQVKFNFADSIKVYSVLFVLYLQLCKKR